MELDKLSQLLTLIKSHNLRAIEIEDVHIEMWPLSNASVSHDAQALATGMPPDSEMLFASSLPPLQPDVEANGS